MKVKTKKKVAIFHCGFIYTGGGERIVLEEISGLRALGWDVDCFVPNYDKNLSYPDIIDEYKIKTFLPQLPKSYPLRFATQMIASCLAAPFLAPKFVKYDIILGANQPGAYIAWVVAKILGKPYFVYLNQPNRVLYPRDHENWQNVIDYYVLNKLINKFLKPVVIFLDQHSIKGGEAIFINGSFVAKEIMKDYGIKEWVDCAGGACAVSQKAVLKDRFKGQVRVNGHTPQKPYLLFTSRHEPWKRFDLAIEIMAKVLEKYPDIRLVIPGAETTVTPKLKDLAEKLDIADRVIFTGTITQKNLWTLYKNAAVYIFTSPREDLGIVVQEAQAAGVPVVAWKRGGPTVTVIDGTTGYLVKPFDQKKMAEKIIYLLENPKIRNKMGQNAREHILKDFSWKKHVNILSEAFEKSVET
jgi:glycosyltransferase involved in cell wall biosynthesis